ncbi:response regulator [Siccirubricoccus sp. KC 17139]|uniref:Response regulator n=1 Tax=Siccirubricoccus soli TaxID=2899147 RepID=A0ABT1D806_9PROT|nr:response regulator [Siccirubricoccus soli]MCO6418074.1 response regulator [Siccirubricoccus soli]MCP2684209.1 response regulator [Siccirubricoccus soli]
MDDFPGLRVLLVEDEGGVALLLEDMLEELGCVVVASAARLAHAYEAVQAKLLDLVVLDVNVAGEASFDLARMLVQRGIPFVFSTGYGSSGLPADLRNQLVLAKPFGLPDLRQSIAAALPKRTSG